MDTITKKNNIKRWLLGCKNILLQRQTFLFFMLVFTLSCAVYLFTLAPTITSGDSGELVTAAYTLGIAHPSGYPLYVLLAKLFTLLPFGTVAWRVNLLSAVFGALTIGVLFLVIFEITHKRIIAASSALLLAFSSIFWSQSIIAKFYPLNAFFVAWLIYMALQWARDRRPKQLLGFAFIYGLSLTNHTTMILLAPAFVCFFICHDRLFFARWRQLGMMLLCFVIGLLVYLYIPLRAWQQPEFNWGPITTWWDVISHITRRQYSDFSPLTNSFSKIGILISFVFELYQEFFWPTLLLAAIGLLLMWKNIVPVSILTLGIFLGNSAGIIFLRKYGWQIGIEYTYGVYYLPALMMVVIWFGYSMAELENRLATFFGNRRLVWRGSQLVIGLVLVMLPITFVINNYRRVDMSSYWFNYDYAKNLLMSLAPNSIYYFAYDGSLQGDTELFSLVYLQLVEGSRPDVAVVSEQNFFYKKFFLHLPPGYFKLSFEDRRRDLLNLLLKIPDRPLYANFAVTQENSDGHHYSVSNLYAYRVYPSLAEARRAPFSGFMPSLRNLDAITADDYTNNGLAGHYFYSLAAFYLRYGTQALSQRALIKAFTFDPTPFNHEYKRFLDYRAEWLKALTQGQNE